MLKSAHKKILIIMTGSIACYKVCLLISRLKQEGHQLKIVMTKSSQQFVGSATIEGLSGESPHTDLYASGHAMEHISLARWADLILVAPATANYINKISAGLADDLASSLFLAHDFQKPFLLAPAMNTKMYQHPATQSSIQKLISMGVAVLETASGVLACGEIGSGRLLEPELIYQDLIQRLNVNTADSSKVDEKKSQWLGEAVAVPQVLITAGGTSEAIDDVRVITNRSTGRTAARLADNFIESGFQVTYLHSENAICPQNQCESHSYESFSDLQSQLTKLTKEKYFDYILHAAAVSDYSPAVYSGKINSDEPELTLHLRRNPKLVNEIKKISPKSCLVAFKLTSTDDIGEINNKVKNLLTSANADYVVQNNWSDVKNRKPLYRLFSDADQFVTLTTQDELFTELFKEFLKIKRTTL